VGDAAVPPRSPASWILPFVVASASGTDPAPAPHANAALSSFVPSALAWTQLPGVNAVVPVPPRVTERIATVGNGVVGVRTCAIVTGVVAGTIQYSVVSRVPTLMLTV
jgi:hypothetical protein